MSSSINKLILILITLLLGVMNFRVNAQTTYDFSYSGTAGVSISGQFIVNSGLITGINGSVSGTSADGEINGLIPPSLYGLQGDNLFSYPGTPSPLLTFYGVSFYTGTYVGNSAWPFTPPANYFVINEVAPTFYVTQGPGYTNLSNGSMIVSPVSGIAPEMNASLIPQVGLLLGCLFLMGRKKEVVEPLLTA